MIASPLPRVQRASLTVFYAFFTLIFTNFSRLQKRMVAVNADLATGWRMTFIIRVSVDDAGRLKGIAIGR